MMTISFLGCAYCPVKPAKCFAYNVFVLYHQPLRRKFMTGALPKDPLSTPPPPYTSSSTYDQRPQQLTSASTASPFPSVFTPPVVENTHHTPSTYHVGPTPPQQLHLPYAYYDPHSDYSVSLADARARTRFIGAVLYALGIWLLVGVLFKWWGEGWTA